MSPKYLVALLALVSLSLGPGAALADEDSAYERCASRSARYAFAGEITARAGGGVFVALLIAGVRRHPGTQGEIGGKDALVALSALGAGFGGRALLERKSRRVFDECMKDAWDPGVSGARLDPKSALGRSAERAIDALVAEEARKAEWSSAPAWAPR